MALRNIWRKTPRSCKHRFIYFFELFRKGRMAFSYAPFFVCRISVLYLNKDTANRL